MSLKQRVLLTISLVIAVYAALAQGAQAWLVTESFQELESVEAEKDVQRVLDTFEREMTHLGTTARDWGFWDDTYRFVSDRNEEFIEGNLAAEAYETSRLDLIYIVDLAGRVVWPGQKDASLDLQAFLPREQWPLDHPLITGCAQGAEWNTLAVSEAGTFLLSSAPILDSARSQPSRGTLVMGRAVNPELLARIRQQSSVIFNVTPLAELASQAEHEAVQALNAGQESHWEEYSDQLVGYVLLRDAFGSGLLLQADVPRDITARGREANLAALAATLAGVLVVLAVLYRVMQRSVVEPLSLLTAAAVRVADTDDLSTPLAMDRDDEIGVLSREFEAMTRKLEQSRTQLVEASRKAGQSDVASNILHNVGNMLNSVNLSADLLREQTQKSSAQTLERILGVLQEHREDLGRFLTEDPRGMKLPEALGALSAKLQEERGKVFAELDSLDAGLDDVGRLVREQQRFARGKDMLELFDVRLLVQQAVRTSRLGRPGKIPIEVEIECDLKESVRGYRHKLLQILLNLLNNARDAVLSSTAKHGLVRVRARLLGESTLQVEVEDSGPGVPAEISAKIFRHGFTTKQDGHGFGLHASANDAKAMGGVLRLAPQEPKRGARFVLEFPFESVVERPQEVTA